MTVKSATTPPISGRNSFDALEVANCIAGRDEWSRLPRLPGGYLRMIHSIESLSRSGGKFQRGYAISEYTLQPDDPVFSIHFADDPVFPGSFELEMILQLGGFLGAWHEARIGRGRAVGVGDLRWLRQVLPDKPHNFECRIDLISIEATRQGRVATFDGAVRCDDSLVCRAKRAQTIIIPLAA